MPAPSPDAGRLDTGDLRACQESLRQGSRTFLAASRLLPVDIRAAACALYAFCRAADDAIDLGSDPSRAVADLQERLGAIYAGVPGPALVDRAFAVIVARHGIPRALPEALIEGFAWDAAGRCYETEDEMLAYASRVAGSVGVMMSLLMGRREARVLGHAADLGMAMQLTNIARDVGEDAHRGRLYLPRQWLREAGIDPDGWLAAPRFDRALAGVVARLLEAAEQLYARADIGLRELPASCRHGIRAARTLYAAIGHEVARRGFDSVSSRAVVPASRKVALVGRSLLAASSRQPLMPVLAVSRHLVDPVAEVYPASVPPADRIAWLIDLMERLERRDLQQQSISA